jgi:hypothetical protein
MIKSKTSAQHGLIPWNTKFNNIQIFGFRYISPNGANVTAYYHTHGAYDPKYDSEIFSDTYDGRGDIPFAKSHEIDGYLATPSGKIKYYNYVNDTITRLQ